MAEETMSIVGSGGNFIRVSSRNKQHCDRCTARSACGLQLLNKASGHNDELSLPLPASLHGKVHAGEEVILRVEDGRLNVLFFLHFIMPVTGAVVATAIAESIATNTNASEFWVILSALAGLAAGLLSIPVFSFLSRASNAGEIINLRLVDDNNDDQNEAGN